jgi:hypothetical protein
MDCHLVDDGVLPPADFLAEAEADDEAENQKLKLHLLARHIHTLAVIKFYHLFAELHASIMSLSVDSS